jgi:hypothetical protein
MTEETKQINNGGPAFPFSFHVGDEHRWAHGAMLRDYFAIKALKTYSDDTEELMLENAIKAYKQADAMLKARAL